MKLNDEMIENFAKEIEEGLPIQYTCDLMGITHISYLNWMKKGEAEYTAYETGEGELTLYAAFFTAIKKAYAKFVRESRNRIRSGASGWQGAAWWLERTNQVFMPKQQIQADEDGKVTVVIGGKQKNVNNK